MDTKKFFPEQSDRFARVLGSLKEAKVAVIGHFRPDGDCIGSIVAVTRLLRGLGIDAIGLNRDPVPANLQAFVGDTPFQLADDFTPDGHVALTVDCADYKRVGERLAAFFPEVAVNIDHHISNKEYGKENFVIAESSATAEVLAGFILDNGYTIDATTAQARRLLRAGRVTSSHSVRSRSSSAASARAAFLAASAELISSFSAFSFGPAICRSSGVIRPSSRICRLISPFLPTA